MRNVVKGLDYSITDQRELDCVPILQIESVAEMVGADELCIDAGSADPREAENTPRIFSRDDYPAIVETLLISEIYSHRRKVRLWHTQIDKGGVVEQGQVEEFGKVYIQRPWYDGKPRQLPETLQDTGGRHLPSTRPTPCRDYSLVDLFLVHHAFSLLMIAIHGGIRMLELKFSSLLGVCQCP